ncbi:hypothetical protein [Pseudarthrobacter sp. 1C304]|uniref:hypothetical protein n=1 Tax=Pseudarthrobacter sp. 1C304 TaxID=3457438 RepID=UPI003FD1200C
MRRRKPFRAALACTLAAGLVLGAAGCAGSNSVADRTYRGVLAPPSVTPGVPPDPTTTAAPAPPGFETPLAGWVDRPRRFGVTLWGSSSCPAVPTRMEVEARDRVSITFEPAGQQACTADLAPTSYEFTAPSGADTVPLTVVLTDAQGRAADTFVLD